MERAIIYSKKVYFRSIEREDIDKGWLEWINDSNIRNNLINPLPINYEQLTEYFEQTKSDKNTVMFAVCLRENNEYIGNARLSKIDWIHRSATYGRLMGPKRGSGLGTESLILLLRYGFHFLGLNRIFSTVWEKNEISLKSNDRVGMAREGVMRQAVYKDGKFHNTIVLSMLREEFDKLHGSPEQWQKQFENNN